MTIFEEMFLGLCQLVGGVLEWAVADTRNLFVLLAFALLFHSLVLVFLYHQDKGP